MYAGYIGKVESTKHAVQLAVSENIRKRTKNKLLIDTNMKINTASQPDIQNGARIDLRLFTKGNWAFHNQYKGQCSTSLQPHTARYTAWAHTLSQMRLRQHPTSKVALKSCVLSLG